MASELWEAVLQGYQTVRPLTRAEQVAIPALSYARHIWLIGAHTRVRERFGDAWLSDDFWISRVQALKMWFNADQVQEEFAWCEFHDTQWVIDMQKQLAHE